MLAHIGRRVVCGASHGRLPICEEGSRMHAPIEEPLRLHLPRLTRHDRQLGELFANIKDSCKRAKRVSPNVPVPHVELSRL